MAWTWEEMIDAFRALGGAADNIAPGTGARGRGIFPVDRAEPVRLHLPENLLIAETDVEFVDGRLKIRDAAKCGQPEREFFEEYQNSFSWGGGGRSDCTAFSKAGQPVAGSSSLSCCAVVSTANNLSLVSSSFAAAQMARVKCST